MGILALAADERVADVEVTEDVLTGQLMDGRAISVPLVLYPRLLNASEAQRKNWQVIGGGYGIHWEEIDGDLSTEGLLRGAPAPHQSQAKAISLIESARTPPLITRRMKKLLFWRHLRVTKRNFRPLDGR